MSGRIWRERAADVALAEQHRRAQGLPEIAARLLAARGVSAEAAAKFLKPTLRDFFPDPSTFADMDKAAGAIEDAIVSGRPTAVFADYDVDGGTSAAQLVRYFRARGRELKIYVPDRIAEGYGPNAGAFEKLKADGVELVITVDCGAAAEGPLNAAAEIGLDVIVLDHHLMSGPPPKALAVVNPNRMDCQSGHGALTAAGVVLVTLAAVNREARKRGSIGSNDLPNPMDNLDLSALGTVCDVAPLTGFNRAIVSQGLKVLSKRDNIGLRALARNAGRSESVPSVYDLGFILGPRINAGGRIGDASLATRLLSTSNEAEADEIAAQLEDLNQERRKREAEMLEEATAAAFAETRPVVIVGSHRWHPGVIGIAAGRLKDKVHKPVIVLGGVAPDEPAKGSGRSVPGVNLGAAVAAAARDGVALAGGGHAMAAGLTVAWERVEALKDFLAEALSSEIEAAGEEGRTLSIDAVGALGAIDLKLLDAIDRIGPYGAGHPEPVFAIPDVTVAFSSALKGGEHVRATLQDARGGKIRAIAWRVGGTAAGDALLARDRVLHVAAKLKRDTYGGGERAELEIVDVAAAS
ncbi:MAG: single-stranded-DNA-specific exonuclease RecJ [Hyphomonadaceae bacterium]